MLVAAGTLGLAVLPGDTGAQAKAQAQARGAAAASAGERAFEQCYSCHALDEDEGALGPSLKGIVGRQVAADPDYDYSAALRAYAARNPRWTRQSLDAFLADPQGEVPDNEMGFYGMTDAAERAALIDYLAAR